MGERPPLHRDKPFGLYLRLSAWLVPSFLLCALVGLSGLSLYTVKDVDRKLSMRVGNFAARVAGGLETIAAGTGERVGAGEQILSTLMADPAVECAELRNADGQAVLKTPEGLGCYPGVEGRQLAIPMTSRTGMRLIVIWNREEVALARRQQFEISAGILLSGLVIAVLTNWLAFRKIIGRPLNDLVRKVEDARSEAEHNALHDSLTGLPNRRHLESELERRAALDEELTILQIDLDDFKPINDTLGHAAGDRVLRRIAARLLDGAAPGEMVARSGGDEFMIVLPSGAGPDAAARRAEDLLRSISEEFEIDGEVCRIGASIGIASGRPDGSAERTDEIVVNADLALYRCKGGGRAAYVIFDDSMRREAETRKRRIDELRLAIERREFVPHYQPQVLPDGCTLVGLEALARWRHPTQGLLSPGAFIPVAEEAGLVDRIDELIMVCALEDRKRWLARGLDVPQIAVNVSARRLYSPSLIEDLRRLEVPSRGLTFEVLETVVIEDSDPRLNWNLDGLRELGIDVEIDDFGTGRASLTSIFNLNPDRIKVAREVIQASNSQGPNMELLQALVALGHSVDVGMVAEGVETPVQLDMVSRLGFERIQGYQIAPPMPADEIVKWLRPSREAAG